MNGLIKDVILPEKIKSYYLFSKIVVGIEINKTKIIATKTRISGTTSTIEQIIEEKMPEEISPDGTDAVAPTLTALLAKIGSYDEIHTTLPSSIAVFKEIKLPFITRDKIAMVIGFEIEPLLPFSLRDAVIDFIITREIPEEKSSEIIVTAVQKHHIAQQLALFETIGIKPAVITIDMIALYGLYHHIEAYKKLTGGTAIITLTGQSTAIAFMIDGQLKTVRTLPKGIIALTKQISQELNKTGQEIIDYLLRFGVEQTDNAEYSTVIQKITGEWWDSVNFTLNSFSAQFLSRQPITKIIFAGNGSLIKGLVPFIEKKTSISSELFTMPETIQDPTCTIKNGNLVTPFNIISASSTLPLPMTGDYNLIQKEFAIQDSGLLLKQLIILVILTTTIFAALITHYFLQTNKLKDVVHTSEQQCLTILTSTFKDLEGTKTVDDELIENAKTELEEKQKRWFAFSNQSRASFLQYLSELSTKIDRKGIDLQVDQIIIGEGALTLKAAVKDYEALKVFERELEQSKLFTLTEAPPETPQFTMKLTLTNSEEQL